MGRAGSRGSTGTPSVSILGLVEGFFLNFLMSFLIIFTESRVTGNEKVQWLHHKAFYEFEILAAKAPGYVIESIKLF